MAISGSGIVLGNVNWKKAFEVIYCHVQLRKFVIQAKSENELENNECAGQLKRFSEV